MILKTREFEGDSPHDVQYDMPLPVKVLADAQSGNITGTTKQVVVATSATLIAEANGKRRSLMITGITGTQITYIGFTNGVSSTTGQYLPASAGAALTIFAKGAVYGIAASSAQTVSVLEESEE